MALSIRRFDFDGLQDFAIPAKKAAFEATNDHTLPEEVEEFAPPPPPSFSQEELEAAKKAAFEEGRLAGEKEECERLDKQQKQREEATLEAMTKLCAQAQQMQQNLVAFKRTQTEELSALLRLLVEKIAGATLATSPTKAIEKMIDECLCVLQNETKVSIQIHPDCFAAIEEKLRITAAQHRLENQIILRENAELGLSDVRMKWSHGEAERNLRDIWKQVETLIDGIDFGKLAESEEEDIHDKTQGENHE